MYSVAVLMSTYNGERFIRDQIDSILSQEGVDVHLYIRDDGSSDNTVSIVNEYMIRNSNITLFQGENLGVGSSFMDLVYRIPMQYDGYAFSDQDDEWLPNKLDSGFDRLMQHSGPVLCCANQILVDKDGKELGLRHKRELDCSWIQILCNNKISGCTMLWNKELQSLLSEEKRRPTAELLRIRIHDVWVAMVAATVGKIVYDEKGYILYRQHENNVVGVRETSHMTEYRKKLKQKKLRCGRSRLAAEISKNYDDCLPSDVKAKMEKYGFYKKSLRRKFSMFGEKEVYVHTGERPLMYWLKVLLGLF